MREVPEARISVQPATNLTSAIFPERGSGGGVIEEVQLQTDVPSVAVYSLQASITGH